MNTSVRMYSKSKCSTQQVAQADVEKRRLAKRYALKYMMPEMENEA